MRFQRLDDGERWGGILLRGCGEEGKLSQEDLLVGQICGVVWCVCVCVCFGRVWFVPSPRALVGAVGVAGSTA